MIDSSVKVGIDLVQVSRISESLAKFGDRFLRRVFTEGEIAYAMDGEGQAAERLAARFAAKEAAIKALGLSDRGLSWQDIEVRRSSCGACGLELRGAAADAASAAGVQVLAISLTHEGDYAAAIVVAHFKVSPGDKRTDG